MILTCVVGELQGGIGTVRAIEQGVLPAHGVDGRHRLRAGGRFNTMPDERVELRDCLDAVRPYPMIIADICGPLAPRPR